MLKRFIAGTFGSMLMVIGMPLMVSAASNVVVTPNNTQGWSTADTAAGGAVNFIIDASSPAPNGALQLTTTASPSSKAQYMHATNTPLASVTDLSYYTKQVSPPGTVADPAYQLPVFLNGGTAGFSTLVFEPYQNPGNNGNATVVNNAWQKWDVDAGLFWSTRTVTCSNGTITGTPGGPASYTLAAIKTACPSAAVAGYGVNIGSNNPSYNVETDLFNFNGTTYDFQAVKTPVHRDQCKQNGYANYTNDNGQPFKNQARCTEYVSNHSREIEGDIKYTANGLKREAQFFMATGRNSGRFSYSDANKDWYKVDVTDTNADGNTGWFAGRVTSASNPSWVGQWLFAKVEDNHPDKIWGDFTTQTAAENGVDNKLTPASGPFDVTKGNLSVRKD
jgi:hypothetical protein